MIDSTLLLIITGLLLFIFSIINILTSNNIEPSLIRAEVVSTISSIIIISIGYTLKKIIPQNKSVVELQGQQGLFIIGNLDDEIKNECAWGSKMILTATAASTILIHINDETILKRGIIRNTVFTPGKICKNVIQKNKYLCLSNTKNYPDSFEFDSIVENLPTVIISPIGNIGVLIVGGWSPRCFTKSDEVWISGWSEKIHNLYEDI